jgi:hypothetical protein
MAASKATPPHCTNCAATLSGPFCAQCGQKAAPVNPSLHDFLHELAHEILHFDGRILRSVRLLLTAPGRLSREAFDGKRVRYVSPIRLYLVFSVLYFAVAAFAPDTGFHVTLTRSDVAEIGRAGVSQDPEQANLRVQELQQKATDSLIHWGSRLMFVLVPVFAGLVALTVRKSRLNYPQHLYFALHVHAAAFCALAIAAAVRMVGVPILSALASLVAVWYVVVYLVLAFRRAYRMTIGRAVLRTAAVGAGYLLLVLLAFLAVIFPTIGIFGPAR